MSENKKIEQAKFINEEEMKARIKELMISISHQTERKIAKEKKQEIFKAFETYSIEINKIYLIALEQDAIERMCHYNRMFHSIVKAIDNYAAEQDENYLYTMGLFNGVYQSYAGMLPHYNEEEIFNFRMSGIIERAHVKDVVVYLYDHGKAQHKAICEAVQITPSQLSRVMDILSDINCVNVIAYSKYKNYTLTKYGEKYVKVILGHQKKEIVDTEYVLVTGIKPRLKMNEDKSTITELDFDDNWNVVGIKYQDIG